MKSLKILNLLYFLVILTLGIYFGKERAIFCDSSMQLYDMASRGFPRVNPSMATTVINYILPFLAILAGLKAKAMVYALAINYLLLTIGTFLFLRFRQLSMKYEVAFLIAFSIFNWQTFYYPIHDYWTGFYLFFILYRVVDDPALGLQKNTQSVCELVLIGMMMFTHLSIVISLGFFYLYLFSERSIDWNHLMRVAAFTFGVFVFKVLFVNSGYQNTLINPTELLSAGNFFTTPTFKESLHSLFRTNANFSVLFIVSVGIGLYLRKFTTIAMLVLFFVASVLVINILFGNYGYSVYTEGYFKSINIVPGIIIANMLLAIPGLQKMGSITLGLNYVFSGWVLLTGGVFFQKHYDFINESCKRFATNVYLRSEKNICPLECLAVSRQSILINQVENDRNNCIFANVRHEWAVDSLNSIWIRANDTKPATNFAFSNEMIYLNADSMNFPIDSFSVLFYKKNCDDMVKRLFPKND